jgi:hypothetical protein
VLAVDWITDDRLALVPACGHVVERSRELDPKRTGHKRQLAVSGCARVLRLCQDFVALQDLALAPVASPPQSTLPPESYGRPKRTEGGTMYARVAIFEAADSSRMQENIDAIRAEVESSPGPPEGLPSKEFLLLADHENGKTLAINLFETEEDLRTGDATLNAMSPPDSESMQRRNVDTYEVEIHVKAPSVPG